jgi:hypothetical protein
MDALLEGRFPIVLIKKLFWQNINTVSFENIVFKIIRATTIMFEKVYLKMIFSSRRKIVLFTHDEKREKKSTREATIK